MTTSHDRRILNHPITRLVMFAVAGAWAWLAVHGLASAWGPIAVPLFYWMAVRAAYCGIRGAKEQP